LDCGVVEQDVGVVWVLYGDITVDDCWPSGIIAGWAVMLVGSAEYA
jgi:hypothetical protein